MSAPAGGCRPLGRRRVHDLNTAEVQPSDDVRSVLGGFVTRSFVLGDQAGAIQVIPVGVPAGTGDLKRDGRLQLTEPVWPGSSATGVIPASGSRVGRTIAVTVSLIGVGADGLELPGPSANEACRHGPANQMTATAASATAAPISIHRAMPEGAVRDEVT